MSDTQKWHVQVEMTITRQFEVEAATEDDALRLARRQAEQECPSAEEYYAKDAEVAA